MHSQQNIKLLGCLNAKLQFVGITWKCSVWNMAVHDALRTFHTFQHKAINFDVVSRVTEYEIIEHVRKEENLTIDAWCVVIKYWHWTCSGGGPQLLLLAGLLATFIKITASIPMLLNYCALFCNICTSYKYSHVLTYSGVPRNFFFWGGGSTNSVEDRGQRERGSGGVAP